MKINDLSKELGVTNNKLITLLKSNGFPVSSHLQNVEPEWEEYARANIKKTTSTTSVKEKVVEPVKTVVKTKTFAPEDMIPCRSITPWRLIETGVDRNSGIIYQWGGFGDVEYVSYRDLQYLKRRDIIKNGKIVIEDTDLCIQWSKELAEYNVALANVNYPEELFDMSDSEFEKFLSEASETVKEVIKYTAMNMIHAENYPTVQKITIIDSVLGTCIKDFL